MTVSEQKVTSPQPGCLARALAWFIWVYSLLMLLILVARWLVGERWLLIGLINNELHLFLMLSLILGIISLLIGRWRPAMFSIPPVILLVVWYGITFLPRHITVPEGSKPLTVLTFNAHAEQNFLDPMVALLDDADADVVALQELSIPAAERFGNVFGDVYPYQKLHPDENPFRGRGVLSRYPIIDDQSWPVEYPISIRLQWVEMDVEGTPIVLYNFHAFPSTPIWGQGLDLGPRGEQIATLLALADQDDKPVILAGDFNLNDLSEDYYRITARYVDAYRAAGWGFGFTSPDWSHDQSREGPGFLPLRGRIDYIFHSRDIRAIEARVWPTSGGSDHRPVLARLAVLPQNS